MDEETIDKRIEDMTYEAHKVFEGYHARYRPLITEFNINTIKEVPYPGVSAVVVDYAVYKHDCPHRVVALFDRRDIEDDETYTSFTTALAELVTTPIRNEVIGFVFPDEAE